MKSAEDRVDLDVGEMSTRFKAMESGRKYKKSKLLNELIGMTDLNLGLDCMMLDALQPYKQLIGTDWSLQSDIESAVGLLNFSTPSIPFFSTITLPSVITLISGKKNMTPQSMKV